MALNATIEGIIKENANGLLGKAPHWPRYRLGDFADIQNGVAYDSKLFNTRGDGMPLLRIRDVGSNRTQAFYVGSYEPREIVQPGDLVIGMDGDFRCAKWDGPPALLNQRVCRVNFRSELVDPDFVLLVLPGYLDAVNAATSSITVKHLSSKTVADLLLPLPPLDEQLAIAARAADRFEAINEGVEEIRAAQLRLSDLETSLRAEAALSDADPVPLSEVALVQSGLTKGRPKGDGLKTVPYIRTANVQAGYLDLEELKELQVTEQQIARHSLQPGDVLILEGGDADKVGRGWIWQGQIERCLHQNHVFAVRPVTEDLDPWFLAHYVNAPAARAYFGACAKQTTNLASINKKQLMALPVPALPVAEQRRRVLRLEAALAETRALRTALDEVAQQLEALRLSVVRGALKGVPIGEERHDGLVGSYA